MRQGRARLSSLLLLEPLLIAAVAPVAFAAAYLPRPVTVVAIGLLALPAIARRGATGRWSERSAANPLVALLLFIFLPLSSWASPLFWQVSWPKLACLLWSIGLFFGAVNWKQGVGHVGASPLAMLTKAYFAFGVALAVASLGGSLVLPDWIAQLDKGLAVSSFYQPNEIAGMLLLFAPLAAALALVPIRAAVANSDVSVVSSPHGVFEWQGPSIGFSRRVAIALALFFSAGIVLTRSRGGVLALVLALVAVVAVRVGRRGWWLLALAATLLIGGWVVVGYDPIANELLNTGADQRLSAEGVLTGRPAIWHSALQAIRDFPLTGVGLGVFGSVIGRLYPTGGETRLEDAHNLYVQGALDLSVVGLVVFVALLGVTVMSVLLAYRNTRPQGVAKFWVVGALAALGGHLLYSVTDAVSLGTVGHAALWFLLGMMLQAQRELLESDVERVHVIGTGRGLRGFIDDFAALWFKEKRRTLRTKSTLIRALFPRRRRYAVAGLAAILVLVSLVTLAPRAVALTKFNLAMQRGLTALFAGPELRAEASSHLREQAVTHCRAHWLIGKLADDAGDVGIKRRAWSRAIACDPVFVELARRSAPTDRQLADVAVVEQPSRAESQFWMAALQAPDAPDSAIQRYRDGLHLDPENGVRWRELGDLLVVRDPDAAIDAYLHSCYNGDPGANGCWLAGKTAEELGRLESAVRYYRLSRWNVARERADELERRVTSRGS